VSRRVLLDTGPLVAFFNRRDRHHEWTVDQWSRLTAPLLTCEAVLSEASFLLSRHTAHSPVLELVERGLLQAPFRLEDEVSAVRRLVGRYTDVPMSLADACLVRMSEQHADCAVLTLDRHFTVYRRHGRQLIRTIMPPGHPRGGA